MLAFKLHIDLGAGFWLLILWIAFFKSIQVSTVAIGLLTFASYPLFTTFLEPVFFKEKLSQTPGFLLKQAARPWASYACKEVIAPDSPRHFCGLLVSPLSYNHLRSISVIVHIIWVIVATPKTQESILTTCIFQRSLWLRIGHYCGPTNGGSW